MKKHFYLVVAVAMAISVLGISALAQPEVLVQHRVNPHSQSPFQVAYAPTAGGTTATSALVNHGGPVMNTPTIYIIWYGNWNSATNGTDTPAGQQIIRNWGQSIGNTGYFALNSSYPPTNSISGQVFWGGESTSPGTKTRLSDSDIKSIVSNEISSGRLPKNTNGVYFVVTASTIAKTGFCTQYCGWHTHATISGSDIKYSFVGNAARCINSCAAQTVGPNGNAGVDGAISVLSHELEEATSDPDLNAWYDSGGAENADKCAWTFGHALSQLPSGAYFNMTFGGRNYLIQRNLWYSGSSWLCMVNSTQN